MNYDLHSQIAQLQIQLQLPGHQASDNVVGPLCQLLTHEGIIPLPSITFLVMVLHLLRVVLPSAPAMGLYMHLITVHHLEQTQKPPDWSGTLR